MSKRNVCFTDTKGLLLMARTAERLKTNRQVDYEKLKVEVAPDVHHVCGFRMPHEAYQTNRLDMRGHWFVKLKNSTTEFWLDVPMTMFNDLTITEELDVTEEIAKSELADG